MFLDDSPKRLKEMEESLVTGDLEIMRRAAHTLKSSSANMGAVLLSQICKDMEEAARNENQDSYRSMSGRCQDAYSEFEDALRLLS
jgi:HPt (histidine-containing phosphotransfer) domain-containing protein